MRMALVTGAAGFIGSHVVDELLVANWSVLALDNFDPFYGREIKNRNLVRHFGDERFSLLHADVRDLRSLKELIREPPDIIIHLAAKVGVRTSVVEPQEYYDVNVLGTLNMLELARHLAVKGFVFASSSSVYGINPNVPWLEEDQPMMPISPYAATKTSGEMLGHVYAHQYGIRFIALRLFTVYGPRQRPDLAIHKFSALMRENKAIPVFGSGDSRRSYTFIGDCVKGVIAAVGYTGSMYEVINIGNPHTTSLIELIEALEAASGLKASIEWLPSQSGDVPVTWSSVVKAERLLGYRAETSLQAGLLAFLDWSNGG